MANIKQQRKRVKIARRERLENLRYKSRIKTMFRSLSVAAQDDQDKAQQIGLAAHQALGCSGYSRVDLLVTDTGDSYVLEVNTLPGMTALSLLPEIAAKGAGLPFEALVSRIIETATLHTKAE